MNQKLSSSERKCILEIQGTSLFSTLQSIQLKFQREFNSCPLPHSPRFSISHHLSGTFKVTIHISRCPGCPAKTTRLNVSSLITLWKPLVFPTTEIAHKRWQLNIPYIPHTTHFPIFTNSTVWNTISMSADYVLCQANVQKSQDPFQLLYSSCNVLWEFLLSDISTPSIPGKSMICSVTNQQRPETEQTLVSKATHQYKSTDFNFLKSQPCWSTDLLQC